MPTALKRSGCQPSTPPVLSDPLRRRAGTVAALLLSLLAFVPASAAESGFHRDRTPLSAKVTGSGSGSAQSALQGSATSGAAVHMLFGLALVLALIYVLYRLLKRSAGKQQKSSGTIQGDDWMSVVASTPLAPSRSIHLVRVGEEIVLVGSAEQGVTPIRVYSADEARDLRIEPRDLPVLGSPIVESDRPSFRAALLESLRRMTAR